MRLLALATCNAIPVCHVEIFRPAGKFVGKHRSLRKAHGCHCRIIPSCLSRLERPIASIQITVRIVQPARVPGPLKRNIHCCRQLRPYRKGIGLFALLDDRSSYPDTVHQHCSSTRMPAGVCEPTPHISDRESFRREMRKHRCRCRNTEESWPGRVRANHSSNSRADRRPCAFISDVIVVKSLDLATHCIRIDLPQLIPQRRWML